ncbi:DUF4282 domain-containing protein [Asaia siamensis]|uniref:Uncharacterized protein n=1 Tax=Asaia siamensis TaxID=110479 RepID=A0ABQ1MHE4_9PROT|nr:DUF4282 domain-containing protein [Asaia siamensis]GBR07034.1 hypothetical protein AA0323_1647 [Asaia siamensis NRIC 0323]GGC40649.1 hypothetical protein GCM10007207_27550 [Asaia siamensis]
MKSLLSFDTLITPKFIKFFFYIGVVICILGGLGTLISIFSGSMAMAQAAGTSKIIAALLGLVGGVIGGVIVAVVGIVLARVSSELTLVIFMIRDELAWQRENALKTPR